jgi:hypothetical protein
VNPADFFMDVIGDAGGDGSLSKRWNSSAVKKARSSSIKNARRSESVTSVVASAQKGIIVRASTGFVAQSWAVLRREYTIHYKRAKTLAFDTVLFIFASLISARCSLLNRSLHSRMLLDLMITGFKPAYV